MNSGTLKLRYNRNVVGWPLLGCSRCGAFLKRHYYVHQCNALPHHWCYDCLVEKGQCPRCKRLYRFIYRASKENQWIGVSAPHPSYHTYDEPILRPQSQNIF